MDMVQPNIMAPLSTTQHHATKHIFTNHHPTFNYHYTHYQPQKLKHDSQTTIFSKHSYDSN